MSVSPPLPLRYVFKCAQYLRTSGGQAVRDLVRVEKKPSVLFGWGGSVPVVYSISKRLGKTHCVPALSC